MEYLNSNSGAIQAIATVILVVVTAIYAWRTHVIAKATMKQADASMRMAEEMRNARSPFITIKWGIVDRNKKEISVNIKNEELGPALNLEWYLTHNKFTFKHKSPNVYPIFEVGQSYPLSLPSENFDFESWPGLAINCDYESGFGEKFSSILMHELKEKRIFERIKLYGGSNQ